MAEQSRKKTKTLEVMVAEVIREFSEKTTVTTKNPDYAFQINGELKFCVEAKAAWVPLSHKEPVFHAKRTARSTTVFQL